MRRKTVEQARARELRAAGRSLREIATELHVALSSVSVWVRHIPREAPDGEPKIAPAQPTRAEGPTRRCGRCRKTLPETAFNRHPKGRQWWCRECFRSYFEARGDVHRRQSAAAKARRRAAAAAYIAKVRRDGCCVECGESDPRILEFDHVGPKRASLAELANSGASKRLIEDEISQCELVCVNCHRRRTGSRAGWRRAANCWWRTSPPIGRERARNIAFAYSCLELTPCVDCGCSDLVALDFDHVGMKTALVLKLASTGVSLARLEAEIEQCEVRCANCHRKRTHGQQLAASGQG